MILLVLACSKSIDQPIDITPLIDTPFAVETRPLNILPTTWCFLLETDHEFKVYSSSSEFWNRWAQVAPNSYIVYYEDTTLATIDVLSYDNDYHLSINQLPSWTTQCSL